MNWNNKVTELLKTQYPLIQAPMVVVSTPEMVAAVSNSGCLGSLPLGYSSKETALEKILAVKKLTAKPFAVNLFAYSQPELSTVTDPLSLKFLYQTHGLPFYDKIPTADPYPLYTELIDLIIDHKIAVVSFHFGIPERDVINTLHKHDIILLATATCLEEAVMIQESGIDMVVAQGIEAGGNRGSFIKGKLPEIGLISLVPQIRDGVQIPVIAAGGLMDGRALCAAFHLGAQGVQLGSIFLRSTESGAPQSYKDAIRHAKDNSTVLTRAWSGRFGRCLENDSVRAIKEKEIFPSPIQNYLTSRIREHGRKTNNPEIQSLWAGQSAVYASQKTVSEIVAELLLETTFHFKNPPFSEYRFQNATA